MWSIRAYVVFVIYDHLATEFCAVPPNAIAIKQYKPKTMGFSLFLNNLIAAMLHTLTFICKCCFEYKLRKGKISNLQICKAQHSKLWTIGEKMKMRNQCRLGAGIHIHTIFKSVFRLVSPVLKHQANKNILVKWPLVFSSLSTSAHSTWIQSFGFTEDHHCHHLPPLPHHLLPPPHLLLHQNPDSTDIQEHQ